MSLVLLLLRASDIPGAPQAGVKFVLEPQGFPLYNGADGRALDVAPRLAGTTGADGTVTLPAPESNDLYAYDSDGVTRVAVTYNLNVAYPGRGEYTLLAGFSLPTGSATLELPQLRALVGMSQTPPPTLPAFIPLSQKGQTNGVATLGSDGKVPETQLPAGGSGTPQGGTAYDDTNLPTLDPATGVTGVLRGALAGLKTLIGSPSTLGRTLIAGLTPANMRFTLGLGNAATRDVGTAAGTVAAGDDPRFASGGSGGTTDNPTFTGGLTLSRAASPAGQLKVEMLPNEVNGLESAVYLSPDQNQQLFFGMAGRPISAVDWRYVNAFSHLPSLDMGSNPIFWGGTIIGIKRALNNLQYSSQFGGDHVFLNTGGESTRISDAGITTAGKGVFSRLTNTGIARDVASLDAVLTDSSDTTRTADLVFSTADNGGAPVERARLTKDGLTLHNGSAPGSYDNSPFHFAVLPDPKNTGTTACFLYGRDTSSHRVYLGKPDRTVTLCGTHIDTFEDTPDIGMGGNKSVFWGGFDHSVRRGSSGMEYRGAQHSFDGKLTFTHTNTGVPRDVASIDAVLTDVNDATRTSNLELGVVFQGAERKPVAVTPDGLLVGKDHPYRRITWWSSTQTMGLVGDGHGGLEVDGGGRVRLLGGTRGVVMAVPTAPNDMILYPGEIAAYRDEANAKLKFRVRLGDGSYGTAELPLTLDP